MSVNFETYDEPQPTDNSDFDSLLIECQGECRLDENDVCEGCGRTIEEIENYPVFNTPEDIALRKVINKKALNRLQDD